LLAAMSAPGTLAASRGFTMIEMMVTVAVIAVLLTLVGPSMVNYLVKKRVEGAASELLTDMQYARSESVTRNTRVRMSFGTYCYVITAQPAAASPASSCSQTGNSTIGTAAAELKTRQLQYGSTAGKQIAMTLGFLSGGNAWIEFDPVRGIATFSDGNASGTVDIAGDPGTWQLQTQLCTMGRATQCSPNQSVKGYSATCAC
jgi:type IV fimbrial biogenesis protein FimT